MGTIRTRLQTRAWMRFAISTTTLLALAGCTEEPSKLLIGSGDTAGSYSAAATAIARVVNDSADDAGLDVADAPTAGSIANVDGVLSGELAFGLAQGDVAHRAVQGLGHWEGKGPQRELRSVFTLFTEVVTVVATRDSGVFTTGQLVGKRIDIGHAGSGSRRNAIDVLDALGVDWRSGTTVHEQTADDRSKMYLGGELDAFFLTAGHPTNDILFAVNSGPGARLVGLDRIDEVIRRHPYYSRTTISLALYPGLENDTPVPTVGMKTVLLTSASTPEETVYALTRAVFAQIESLGKFDPVLRTLTRAEMVQGMNAPLHPGAERYFREAGLLGGG